MIMSCTKLKRLAGHKQKLLSNLGLLGISMQGSPKMRQLISPVMMSGYACNQMTQSQAQVSCLHRMLIADKVMILVLVTTKRADLQLKIVNINLQPQPRCKVSGKTWIGQQGLLRLPLVLSLVGMLYHSPPVLLLLKGSRLMSASLVGCRQLGMVTHCICPCLQKLKYKQLKIPVKQSLVRLNMSMLESLTRQSHLQC